LVSPRAGFESDIGVFGSQYANPYQNYLLRQYDSGLLGGLHERAGALAIAQEGGTIPDDSGYGTMPQNFVGQYFSGTGPGDVRARSAQQLQTLSDFSPEQRALGGMNVGSGALAQLIGPGTFLPKGAVAYLKRRLPLEKEIFDRVTGSTGTGDFLSYFMKKYKIADYIGRPQYRGPTPEIPQYNYGADIGSGII
jgi:hypothetical protein